jgi:methylmalonyl-CoA mutase N-terminal domain/subunit
MLEQKQVDRVRSVRARRESLPVEEALLRLKEASLRDSENLMPHLIEASRAYATLGEMCDVLRETWGTWTETPVF